MWDYFEHLTQVAPFIDVVIVSLLVYQIILFVKGTRAVPMLGGLAVLLVLYWLSTKIGLVGLNWLLGNFLGSVILVVVVLFQDDLRRGLVNLGLIHGFRGTNVTERENTFRQIARTCKDLASKKIGAIMVISGKVGLKDYYEEGVQLDALVSRQLLISIFQTDSPLHDGALVIDGDRAVAAGVVLPLSFNQSIASSFGTRHRAAMGLSERTDAVILVVSEESGEISIFHDGKLTRDVDEKILYSSLQQIWKLPSRKRRSAKEVTATESSDLERAVDEKA